MLVLATFDLSGADLALFEQYEAIVLPLLARHGATLRERVRSLDSVFELHLLEFADEAAFQAYGRDPDRLAAQELFERSRAEVVLTPVRGV